MGQIQNERLGRRRLRLGRFRGAKVEAEGMKVQGAEPRRHYYQRQLTDHRKFIVIIH